MNIRDYMASEITTLRAGGPGSGRHPGDVARAFGYKVNKDYPTRGANKMYEHEDGQSLVVRGDNHWTHSAKYGAVKTGDGAEELQSHLERVHGNIDV